jgi:hypothetical protein
LCRPDQPQNFAALSGGISSGRLTFGRAAAGFDTAALLCFTEPTFLISPLDSSSQNWRLCSAVFSIVIAKTFAVWKLGGARRADSHL